MAGPVATGISVADHLARPDSRNREDLICGELFVTPPPSEAHQDVVGAVYRALFAHAFLHGGKVMVAPFDVVVNEAEATVMQPDVCYVRAEHLHSERPHIRGAPDLVVEVASPSTRRHDATVKRDAYARAGIAELWLVDMQADEIAVHHLDETTGDYGEPERLGRSATLQSRAAPELEVAVGDILAAGAD